jgi:hypothetical protein
VKIIYAAPVATLMGKNLNQRKKYMFLIMINFRNIAKSQYDSFTFIFGFEQITPSGSVAEPCQLDEAFA